MKKTYLLNSEISYVIARMGHFDRLVICDAGLPIPIETYRIDVAICAGIPSFEQVLRAVMSELRVQKAIVAREMKEHNAQLYCALGKYLGKSGIILEEVPHESFKNETKSCLAIVRTGETKAFANIILESGVTF